MRGRKNQVQTTQLPAQITLENIGSWYEQYRYKQPTTAKEFVEGLCEYHCGLSTAQIRALSAYHAQLILNPTASNKDKNDAMRALIALRELDISVAKMIMEGMQHQQEQSRPHVSDEEYKASMVELLESRLEDVDTIDITQERTTPLQIEHEYNTIPMEDVG